MDEAITNIIVGCKWMNTTIPANNTISNTASETTFNSTILIPANSIQRPTLYTLKAWGVYSAAVTATLRSKVKLNTTTIIDTGVLSGLAVASNLGWSADFNLLFQSVGSTATLDVQGYFQYSTALSTSLSINVPNISTYTIDTTIDQTISLTEVWNTASPSNSITLRQLVSK